MGKNLFIKEEPNMLYLLAKRTAYKLALSLTLTGSFMYMISYNSSNQQDLKKETYVSSSAYEAPAQKQDPIFEIIQQYEQKQRDPSYIKQQLAQYDKIFGYDEVLQKIAKVESNYNASAVSYKGAYGVMQITYQGYKGLVHDLELAKAYYKKIINKDAYEKANLDDLESFKDIKLKGQYSSQTLNKIKYVYLPLYKAYQELLDGTLPSWALVKETTDSNIAVGALIFYRLANELTNSQVIKTKKGYEVVMRSPSYFDGREHLRAISLNDLHIVWAAYNMGITAFKKKLEKHGLLYFALKHIPKETKIGLGKLD